jgi:hypothetical protein
MYLQDLKFEFFEIRPHPRISLALERYAAAVYSRLGSAALVCEKLSCLVNGMYLYVLVRTFKEILYWYVLVCTGMCRYVPVHTILPDPVQVYRIPDEWLGRATVTVTVTVFRAFHRDWQLPSPKTSESISIKTWTHLTVAAIQVQVQVQVTVTSGFLPPQVTMSYVRTMSYVHDVRHRHGTCNTRHCIVCRTCDVVRASVIYRIY